MRPFTMAFCPFKFKRLLIIIAPFVVFVDVILHAFSVSELELIAVAAPAFIVPPFIVNEALIRFPVVVPVFVIVPPFIVKVLLVVVILPFVSINPL